MPPSVASVSRDAAIDTLLQGATSMNELIDLLPPPYRAPLAKHLRTYFAMSQKISNAQQVIASLNKHASEGTFPQTVVAAIKLPNVQYSKEYVSSSSGKDWESSLQTLIQTGRKSLMVKLTAQKIAELNTLQECLKFKESEWKSECTRIGGNLATALGIEAPDGAQTPFAKDAPADLTKEFERVHKYGKRWYTRAVSLAYVAIEKQVAKKMQKLSLRETAEAEMTDAPAEKPTAQVMDEKLSAFKAELLKELKAKPPAKKSGGATQKKKKTNKVTKTSGKAKGAAPKGKKQTSGKRR